MNKEDLVKAGLSEDLAEQIAGVTERVESLEASNTGLQTTVNNLTSQNEKLQSDLDTHEAALQTSETARENLERQAAEQEAKAESDGYQPLTVSEDACLALANFAKKDAEAAKTIREALNDAKDQLATLQEAAGIPRGEAPSSTIGNASPLSEYVHTKMAEGMTRVEALATPEAKQLAAQEREANIRRAATESD